MPSYLSLSDSHSLIPSVILEKHTDTLPMMYPANCLCKHLPHLQHLQFLAPLKVLVLRHRVRHDHFVQVRGVDPLDGIARENAVRDQSVNGSRARFLEQFGGAGDGVGGVGQIIDKNCASVGHGADEKESGGLAGRGVSRSAFLQTHFC